MKKIEIETLLEAYKNNQAERKPAAHWRVVIKSSFNQPGAVSVEEKDQIGGFYQSNLLNFSDANQLNNLISFSKTALDNYLKSHRFETEPGRTNYIDTEIYKKLGFVFSTSRKIFSQKEAEALAKEWQDRGLDCFTMLELQGTGMDLHSWEILRFTKHHDQIKKPLHVVPTAYYNRIPASCEAVLLGEKDAVISDARKQVDSVIQGIEQKGLAVHIKDCLYGFAFDGIVLTREGIRTAEALKEEERLDFLSAQETKRGKVCHISCPSCGEVYFQTSALFDPTKRLTGSMVELLPNLDPAMWLSFSGDDIGDSLACPNCQETLPNYDGFLSPSSLVESDTFDTESEPIVGSRVDESGGHARTFSNAKNEVLRLLDEGLPQINVADTLGIHKATVSKVRKRAIADGLLTQDNKLTQPGLAAVGG